MHVARFLTRAARDERGVAAVEMALVGGLLATAMLNVVEVSRYAYVTTQVSAASQAGAHAAIVTCDPTETPATTNCPALATAVSTAIHGSSLGSQVSLHGAIAEAWYCVNPSTGALQQVAAAGSPPDDCSAVGSTTEDPALYLRVETQYSYQPIFPGLTIASTFSSTIVRVAWMRMR